jgi:STE24 endopeptidase
MNIYAIVILTTLLVAYFLNLIADILNLRALSHEVPANLNGLYDREAYRSSQRYTRIQTRFGWFTSTWLLAVTLVFWFAGGFQVLDVYVRSWSLGPIASGLLYIGILLAGQALLRLPLQLYSTFVIEARFGFNQTSLATFCADRLKGMGLAIVLGGALLAGVLAFLMYAGPYAWLYCWVAITFFSLALQLIAPTWIMPLFHKFTPLAPGELRRAIVTYAQTVKFPIDDVYVMDGSKRSSKSNAFFTGFGKHKRIALFDTLVDAHTVPELLSVVAHEVGHYKMRHIVKNTVLGIAHTGVMLYLLSVFLHDPGLFAAFYVTEPSVYAGLVFFGMLYAPVELLLSIGMQIVSRQHEYDADRYAVETAGNPEAMGNALKKLALHNLTNLTPHPFYVFLHYSHPPIWQRLQAIEQLGAQSKA